MALETLQPQKTNLVTGGGKTYSQLSAESLANPGDTALAAKVQTVFQGTTLRGLLLNAYAFWKIGQPHQERKVSVER